MPIVERHPIEVGIFFSLDQPGLPAMLIDSQLADDGAQPPTQRADSGIVTELSAWLSIFARPEAMKLCPDRLGHIIGHRLVRAGRARGRANGRAVACKQIVPGVLIAT